MIRAILHLIYALAEAAWLRVRLLFQRLRHKPARSPGSQESPALPFPREEKSAAPVFFQALPAHNGDALLIEYVGNDGDAHRIWIDGGLVKSYEEHGKPVLTALQQQQEKLDLMVVTHIDQDHIGGILAFMRDKRMPRDMVYQVWFNSARLLSAHFRSSPHATRNVSLADPGTSERSLNQGLLLEDELTNRGVWHEHLITRLQRYDLFGATLTVLSPSEEGLARLNREWQDEMDPAQTTRGWGLSDHQEAIDRLAQKKEEEDNAIPNGSSIALLYEYQGRRLLLAGDAQPSVIVDTLRQLGYSPQKRLPLDCFKLSHHGSKYSTSYALLSLVDCYRFLISTDGSRHHLPHKETLARIVMDPTRDFNRQLIFVFNHDTPLLRGIFSFEEQQKYNFTCRFPARGSKGIVMEF